MSEREQYASRYAEQESRLHNPQAWCLLSDSGRSEPSEGESEDARRDAPRLASWRVADGPPDSCDSDKRFVKKHGHLTPINRPVKAPDRSCADSEWSVVGTSGYCHPGIKRESPAGLGSSSFMSLCVGFKLPSRHHYSHNSSLPQTCMAFDTALNATTCYCKC